MFAPRFGEGASNSGFWQAHVDGRGERIRHVPATEPSADNAVGQGVERIERHAVHRGSGDAVMKRKERKKKRRPPGAGSRLRNTETFRVTSNHDRETFLHIHDLAERGGVTLSEQMRQLVEFGLEVVQEADGKDGANASVTQTRT